MNKIEKENFKLKAENKHLKDEVEKLMRIYRENLYEISELIDYALRWAADNGVYIE